MRAVKAQFFLCYAVMGSLMAYLPLHLAARGLDKWQVAVVMGSMGVAVIITPVLVTLLADLRVSARLLLLTLFTLAGAALCALELVDGFVPLLVVYVLHALALVPAIPVQDGVYFALQRRRLAAGELDEPYHRVRVWGTIGFIVPSLVLYVLLRDGGSTSWAVIVGAAMCALAAVNSLRLPRDDAPAQPDSPRGLLPTVTAARRIFAPAMLPFTIAMWLCLMATSAYYTFYPPYLTEPPINVLPEWVGLITSIGVVIEIAFMLGFGRLLQHLGLRRLLILAASMTTLRMALLWLWPHPFIAIATQGLHGMMVLLIHVAPPVYLNRHADAANRSSMQGLFAMSVAGTARIGGNLIAGPVADVDLPAVFLLCAGLCAAATLLLSLRFRETAVAQETA